MDSPSSGGVSVSRRTHVHLGLVVVYGAFTLFGCAFQHLRLTVPPGPLRGGAGSSAFARHYSRNTVFSSGYSDVSLPPVPSYLIMCSSGRPQACPCAGFPIRIPPDTSGCTRLPGAFRSVPRPSSARDAQASPIRPGSFSSTCVAKISSLYLALLSSSVVFVCTW